MNKSGIIIFLSIVLTIYFSVNTYIFIRGLQALQTERVIKISLIILFWFVVLCYPAGRILDRVAITWYSQAFTWIGAIWLATMAYFFLSLILIDIVRSVNHFFPFLPEAIKANYDKVKMITLFATCGIVFSVILYGYINAKTPQVTELEISVNKTNAAGKRLNIVAATDIHLGTIISNSRIEHIVEKINSLNPDIVLLPGDVVDEDLAPVIKNNLGETLSKIKAKYGVYAVTGNHEYFGGVEAAVKYLREHGINVLRDSTVLIENSFYLVGREDRSYRTRDGVRRKPLIDLVQNIDKSLPLIIMDHQPFKLEEAEENGVDLQISGHTHNGQLWPFNYITDKVYELSWGYKKKGNTNYYVSCGAGTWGPPIKTGNISEIVNIKILFK